MVIIGERINGMFKDVKEAIQKKDKKVVQKLAIGQIESGTDYLDVNVGTAVPSSEKNEAMVWLIEAIQAVTSVPICIDSPRLSDIEVALKVTKTPPMINSTQADPDQLETYLGLAIDTDASLIALAMDKNGVPQDIDRRIELSGNIVVAAMEADFPFEKLFIDSIILPVNATQQQPGLVLETLQQLKQLADPPPHFVLGLSNVSQGTKERSLINRTYLTMCIAMGLDAAILNPFDEELMNAMITAELLLNKHIYNDSFLAAYRSSKITHTATSG